LRIFITVLVLILSLQSITKADDIRDFQIEGMSIGDSLLNYYSEKEIKNQKKNFYPKSKKIYMIEFFDNLKSYDAVAFHLQKDDKEYKIESIKGVIFFDKNIKKCRKKMTKIELDVSNSLNIEKNLYEEREYPDKRGKAYIAEFKLNKDRIRIWCVNFFKKQEKLGSRDNLALSIEPYKFSKWLKEEAW